jgi:hypothetical protein
MLADFEHPAQGCGSLGKHVHLPATSLHQLLAFITDELPRWRDRPDRKREASETVLSSQLCAHLNSAVRRSKGWDFLQFRAEEPDESTKGRKTDLVPAPCDTTVWVEGRRHTDFDPLLPIECKRLPTPNDKKRDEREYVYSRFASIGGIQRFKEGHHGAIHKLGAMIAYVQEETCAFWDIRIVEWINGLIGAGQSGWTAKDLLRMEQFDSVRMLAVLSSSHMRAKNLPEIELRHLWVQMT